MTYFLILFCVLFCQMIWKTRRRIHRLPNIQLEVTSGGFEWSCMFSGQATATLLRRLYYNKGGQSQWLAALVQAIGFPILIPFYFMSSPSSSATTNSLVISNYTNPPSISTLTMVYGVLLALYALGPT